MKKGSAKGGEKNESKTAVAAQGNAGTKKAFAYDANRRRRRRRRQGKDGQRRPVEKEVSQSQNPVIGASACSTKKRGAQKYPEKTY